MAINNDSEFKISLSGLSGPKQRQVAARFAENVLALSKDARVKNAINAAKRTDISEDELAAVLQSAKKATVDSSPSADKSATGTTRPAISLRKRRWPASNLPSEVATRRGMPPCMRAWRAPARASPLVAAPAMQRLRRNTAS